MLTLTLDDFWAYYHPALLKIFGGFLLIGLIIALLFLGFAFVKWAFKLSQNKYDRF